MLAIKQSAISFTIWPIAFLAVVLPLWINLTHAKVEAREDGYFTNAQIEALYITFLLTLIGFFVFAFNPKTMEIIYNWVPYIGS